MNRLVYFCGSSIWLLMHLPILRKRADYVGIAGSVLCIIHCLLTPILLVTSAWLQHDTLRTGFLSLDYVFIIVNVVAVWSASRSTSSRIKRALWLFLGLFAAGLLLEGVAEAFAYLAYGASLGLVITHLVNIRYCRIHHVH